MSLFKKNILSQYNILGYKDSYLYLHCSRYDTVVAPFTGSLDTKGNLIAGNKILSLKNVKLFNDSVIKVRAGDKIGIPIVSKYNGQLIANIGLMLTENNKILYVLKYLQRRDIDEVKKSSRKKKEEKIIEEVVSIPEEYIVPLNEIVVAINKVNSEE